MTARRRPAAIHVLGLDPGFASFGWTVAELSGGGLRVLSMGVIRTAKNHGRQRVLAADDNVRRARAITASLCDLCASHDVRLICAEAMSHMRQASSAAKVSMAWGVVAAMAEERGLPIATVSPQALKRALCGKVAVTDRELHAEVERRFPEVPGLVAGLLKTQREHAYDAVGAIEACRESETFRVLEALAR